MHPGKPGEPCGDLAVAVTDTDHSLGPADAAVTVVEYGDYECPDCLNAVPIMTALREHFGNRLRIVFRHFPISSIHPGASAAAIAAEAAAAQGRFWEMHEALFRRQRELFNVDLTHLALRLDIELYKFEQDRESAEAARRLREDLDSGTASGVRGTPTFFINGCRFRGTVNLPTLQAAIDAANTGAEIRKTEAQN
jgi:protein-disulfide isomerase